MKTPTTLAIAFAAVVSAAAAAQDAGRSPVDLVLERLADPVPARAHAAMVALARGGPGSTPVLRRALERCEDPAVAERIRRALRLCEVDAPASGGLALGLFADETELAPGKAVRLTVRLCNRSDERIVVYTGMSYSGSVFENGLALQRVGEPDEAARLGMVGFCGTGARMLTVALQPWSCRETTIIATLRVGKDANGTIPCEGPRLECGFVYLALDPERERQEIRLRYAIERNEQGGMLEPEAQPTWTGEAVSNRIELRIRGL